MLKQNSKKKCTKVLLGTGNACCKVRNIQDVWFQYLVIRQVVVSI